MRGIVISIAVVVFSQVLLASFSRLLSDFEGGFPFRLGKSICEAFVPLGAIMLLGAKQIKLIRPDVRKGRKAKRTGNVYTLTNELHQ